MKKIALPFMIILLVMNISFLPARAMDFTIDFGSISTIGDIGYGLAGGASFDFNNSKYKIDNYDVMSTVEQAAALNEAADQWLSDYAALRVPSMYMTTEYRKMVETANRNYWLANGDTAAERDALKLGLNPTLFSSWARYNDAWVKNYVDSLSIEESDPVEPDPNYDYIRTINHWTLCNTANAGYPKVADWFTSEVWCSYRGNGITLTRQNQYNFSYVSASFLTYHYNPNESTTANRIDFNICEPISIYITSTNNSATISYSSIIYRSMRDIYPTLPDYAFDSNHPWRGNSTKQNISIKLNGVNNSYVGGMVSAGIGERDYSYTDTSFNSLSDALDYVYTHYCNINLFVNNTPWAIAGEIQLPDTIEPTFDFITTPDGDLAPDVIMPEVDDAFLDITSLFDAIRQAIAEASTDDAITGDGILDIDDVIDNSGIIDAENTAVGTIAIPFADTIPRVIEDIDPPMPDFPIITLPIHNAFSGTTVLSELVDATQTVLPDEIMYAFWGIIFILFIIGLIHIFHK